MHVPQSLSWIVAGSMTGPGARPAQDAWFRELRDWCSAFEVPFLLKQLDAGGLRLLDGREHNDLPWEDR
jgi:protein gp37